MLISRSSAYLEELGVGRVEGGVSVGGVVLAREVEEPGAEEVAVAYSDGVSA